MALAVKRRPRIQKVLDRPFADYLAQLFLGEWIFAVFPLFEGDFLCLQETSCFAASRSRGFVDESDLFRHSFPHEENRSKVQGFKVQGKTPPREHGTLNLERPRSPI